MTQDRVASQVGISKPYLSNIETGKAKNPPTDGILRGLERTLGFKTGELKRIAHLARTPLDVQHERDLLEAEVQKLRGVLKGLLTHGPRKASGSVDLDALNKRVNRLTNIKNLAAGPAVPIINKVPAGYPRHFTDLDYPPSVAQEYVRCPDMHDAQAFAARVVGDSMEPDYHEGDIVVFSPNTPARAGDDCFVRFEADAATTFKRFYQDEKNTIRLQPLNSEYPAETHPRERITGLWPAMYRVERLRT